MGRGIHVDLGKDLWGESDEILLTCVSDSVVSINNPVQSLTLLPENAAKEC